MFDFLQTQSWDTRQINTTANFEIQTNLTPYTCSRVDIFEQFSEVKVNHACVQRAETLET